MNDFAHELSLGDVYFSPFLLVVILAFIVASITTVILNKAKLSKYFYTPTLSFLALMTLYVVLIDAFLIKI